MRCWEIKEVIQCTGGTHFALRRVKGKRKTRHKDFGNLPFLELLQLSWVCDCGEEKVSFYLKTRRILQKIFSPYLTCSFFAFPGHFCANIQDKRLGCRHLWLLQCWRDTGFSWPLDRHPILMVLCSVSCVLPGVCSHLGPSLPSTLVAGPALLSLKNWHPLWWSLPDVISGIQRLHMKSLSVADHMSSGLFVPWYEEGRLRNETPWSRKSALCFAARVCPLLFVPPT